MSPAFLRGPSVRPCQRILSGGEMSRTGRFAQIVSHGIRTRRPNPVTPANGLHATRRQRLMSSVCFGASAAGVPRSTGRS